MSDAITIIQSFKPARTKSTWMAKIDGKFIQTKSGKQNWNKAAHAVVAIQHHVEMLQSMGQITKTKTPKELVDNLLERGILELVEFRFN